MQLEQAEGQLARDQALLANARVDLARDEVLAAQNAIPKQQLDTQRATVRRAVDPRSGRRLERLDAAGRNALRSLSP